MVNIKLFLNKSVEQNAELYYEKAKKAKKKLKGAEEAVEKIKKKLEKLEKEQRLIEDKEEKKIIRKKEWYEKFRWFYTSEGFLVVGGRDATTNEIVIKKHTEKEDLVFHTDMSGSPFFVIKSDGKKINEKSIKETADATVTFSRAWKLGFGEGDVFYVKPDQVTKEAQSGEYLTKGSFMIKGKTNYVDNNTDLAVGLYKTGAVMAGPLEAVKKNCEKYVVLEQGKDKASDIAKKIKKKLEGGELDEIVRVLPAGNYKIKK